MEKRAHYRKENIFPESKLDTKNINPDRPGFLSSLCLTFMRMENTIQKRLVKINAFLGSKKKPTLKVIHALRLEVKHLEAFLELMILQDNFGARPGIPYRLEKLFHEAGKLRKYGLEMKAIESISDHSRLPKPTLFLQQIRFFKKKTSKKLQNKQKAYRAFKPGEFARHPGVRLSSDTWQRFMINTVLLLFWSC